MFCKNCGSNIDDKAVMCPHCGVPTDNMYTVAPVNNQLPKSNNALSIAGFVVALVGLCGGNFLILIPGIVGIILSFIGFIRAKKENSSIGLSCAGLAVSAVSLAFWIYVWIEAFKLIAQEGVPPVII